MIGNKKFNLSTVFSGQKMGISQKDDKIWLVSFMDYDLGYFDTDSCRIEPIDNPFAAKVLPMSQEQINIKWRARTDSNGLPPGS